MRLEPGLERQMGKMFASLDKLPAGYLPPIGSLSEGLGKIAPQKGVPRGTHNLDQRLLQTCSTSAINMWTRAVHSFLVSASLTSVSPIWASVSGYYSSHYSVRALAHALGFFHLFNAKRNVQIELANGRFVATFDQKHASDREHKIYWVVVKRSPLFTSDPLFTKNEGERDPSDVRHRDRANYADHLPQFPAFAPLDRLQIIDRVQHISDIEITSPPIPSAERYPDVEAVQVVAYHRLVRFRDLLDQVLGGTNRYWSVSRDPAWAREFLDYQAVEADY